MNIVKVYGSGCKRCKATEAMVRDTATQLGVEIDLQEVTDLQSIAMAGIMSTPGVTVDGQLVHAGGLPDAAKVAGWLRA